MSTPMGKSKIHKLVMLKREKKENLLTLFWVLNSWATSVKQDIQPNVLKLHFRKIIQLKPRHGCSKDG